MKKIIKLLVAIFALSLISCSLTACNDKTKEKAKEIGTVVKKVAVCFYDGAKLTWNELKDLDASYDVSVNGEKVAENIKVPECEFDCVSSEMDVVVTTHYVENGENKTVVGNKTHFISSGAFTMPVINYGIVSWDAVEGATGYLVKEGTNPAEIVTGTTYDKLSSGTHSVQIKPIIPDVNTYYTYSSPLNVDIIASPVIRFEKSTKTIYWDTVDDAAGYFIKIEKDGLSAVDIAPFGKNAVSYNGFQFKDAGNYTISISAKGDSEANKDDSKFYSMNIIRLETPTFVETRDLDSAVLVQWSAVRNAASYNVELPSGSVVNTSDVYTIFPLETSMVEENLKFKVYSSSNLTNVLDSDETLNIDATRLAMVTNVKLQDAYLTWNSVPKAQSYTVNIDGTAIKVDNTQYLLDISEGSHVVKVKANGNGKEIVASSYSTETTISKLPAPMNLRIDSSVLSWDAVTGCTSYSIYLDNGANVYNATTNSVVINRSDISSTCALYVVARGDGNLVADSNSSLTKMLYILDTPTVSANKYGIEWIGLENATSYSVEIGDYRQNVTGTSFSLESYPAASYVVYVTAVGDQSTYFDSARSSAISVRKLSDPIVNITAEGITWGTVVDAQAYEVRIDDGTPENFGSNVRKKDAPLFKTAGTHTVSVRAIGDGIQGVASSWVSVEKVVTLLEQPESFSITKEGNKLTITAEEVENANGYIFNIGGVPNVSTTNSYECDIKNAGLMIIKVATKGDGVNTVDSAYTVEKNITILNDPQNVTFVKQDDTLYTINWNPVQNASAYKVTIKKYIDGTIASSNDYTINSASVEVGVEGYSKIDVEITSLGDGLTTFDSGTVQATKMVL